MQPSAKSQHPHDKENHDGIQKTAAAAQQWDTNAQKECACECPHQLANIGSENEDEGDADNDEEGTFDANKDDDNTSDTQAQHCIVATKLSGVSKQPPMFHNNKVPRTPCISATAIEALEALMALDSDTDDEHHTITSITSSEVETVKQKKVRDKHSVETITHEPETMKNAIEHAVLKRQHEIGVEDVNPTTVKAQKLTNHKGHPHAKDYDDVIQEFMTTAIGDYHAHLCAQSPMPNHGQETALLAASWTRACQVTGVKLAQTPNLSKLISGLL
ncbi:hypothetical protein BKA82DRAFT_4356213 [Pisolithus tinctorius]|nr:hypothetical protein BKA82DRAFT_4356213 [Pisolithus tinctorius]